MDFKTNPLGGCSVQPKDQINTKSHQEEKIVKDSTMEVPQELIQHIFSYLDPKDAIPGVCVSNMWKAALVTKAKREQGDLLINFIKFIKISIESKEHPETIEKLDSYIAKLPNLNDISLLHVKNSLDSIFDDLIQCLLGIVGQPLEHIEKYCREEKIPMGFSDFIPMFKLVEAGQKDSSLKNIVDLLLKNRRFDRALEVALMISEEPYKAPALLNIIRATLKEGKIEKAHELSSQIPDSPYYGYKANAYVSIIQALLSKKRFAEAINMSSSEVFNYYNSYTHKAMAIENIIDALYKNEKLEDALKMALELPIIIDKAFALQKVVNAPLKDGNIDKALELASTIPSDKDLVHYKAKAFKTIVMALLEGGNIDKAIKVALMIPHDATNAKALEAIVKVLLKDGNIDKAIEVAKIIPLNDYKSSAFFNVVKAFLENGDITKANEVASNIPYSDYRATAFKLIEAKSGASDACSIM